MKPSPPRKEGRKEGKMKVTIKTLQQSNFVLEIDPSETVTRITLHYITF